MADLDIAIAGRSYRVACEEGQENNLAQAAQLVAEEADSLREQFGSHFAGLPESRVLLMAALMLGDRFRAHLAEAPAAGADRAGAEGPADPAAEGAAQAGLFEARDPDAAARVAELEAELAEAREGEAAAVAALDDAAARVREMAAEMREGAEDEPEDVDMEDGFEADFESGEIGEEDGLAPAFADEAPEDRAETPAQPGDEAEPEPEDDPRT